MRRRWWLGLTGVALAGCTTPRLPDAGPATTPSTSPQASARTEQSSQPPAKEPAGFKWTDQPDLAKVPRDRVIGYVGGRQFDPKAVVFEHSAEGWALLICERPLPSPSAPVTDGVFLRVMLPGDPLSKPGGEVGAPLGPGNGFWRVTDPDDPTQTTNWYAKNAWKLSIGSASLKPYNRKGPAAQVVGTAAGKLAVCYLGSRRLPNAWVAGTFNEAVVRYLAPPKG